jgi:peroxiredoxin
LVLYPRGFGLLCTRQLSGYAEIVPSSDAIGAVVVAVSCDDLDSHLRFVQERGFRFPLVADPDGAAAAAWGVRGPLRTAKRASFVVDGDGFVRRADASA